MQAGKQIGSIDESFRQFLAGYPKVSYKKGQSILLKGDLPKGSHLLLSGSIKAYDISPSGDERIIHISGIGEDVPIGFTLGLTNECQYYYQAFTDSTICLVPREELVRYLKSRSDILFDRHIKLANILIVNLEHIRSLGEPKMGKKVASALLYFSDTLSSKLLKSDTRRLTLTQQEIADLLGVTRETTSTELKKLKRKGVVDYTRRIYIVYLDKIRKYLED